MQKHFFKVFQFFSFRTTLYPEAGVWHLLKGTDDFQVLLCTGRFDPYKLRDYVSHTVKVSKNRVITWQFNSAQNADDVNITFFLWEDGK